jgi:hypothetical protein
MFFPLSSCLEGWLRYTVVSDSRELGPKALPYRFSWTAFRSTKLAHASCQSDPGWNRDPMNSLPSFDWKGSARPCRT